MTCFGPLTASDRYNIPISSVSNVCFLQAPDGNRIPILSQAVKEIVISLLNHPTDSSLKAVVQVLKVRHGSHRDWKTGKAFSGQVKSQGILMRPEKSGNFTQNIGKIRNLID